MHEDMKQVAERQAQVYSTMIAEGNLSEDDKKDALTHMEAFEEFCVRMMKKLEKQYGIVAELPNVAEGEHETNLSAPRMRLVDSRTIKEFVYREIVNSAASSLQPALAPVPVHVAPQQYVSTYSHPYHRTSNSPSGP